MSQVLIVEGKDAIALSVICQKASLNPPVGYEDASKYKKEFVKEAGGVQSALRILEEVLDKPEYTNVGIIVDANEVGYEHRWREIRQRLTKVFSSQALENADVQSGFKIVEETGKKLKVGIWVMPDNASGGYLEHFLINMIAPPDDPLLKYVEKSIDELLYAPFNELKSKDEGKAKLYTWLAWKAEPGKPFGQAINAGYLSWQAPAVEPLLRWFKQTFQLS